MVHIRRYVVDCNELTQTRNDSLTMIPLTSTMAAERDLIEGVKVLDKCVPLMPKL